MKLADTVLEIKQLDEETKKVLGEDPESAKQKDIDLHPDLVQMVQMGERWFGQRNKNKILAKYSRKGNLSLEAPTLNAEIAATLNEAGTKRDNLFIQEQNFAGTALSALGEAISMILRDENEPIDRMKLLKRLAEHREVVNSTSFSNFVSQESFYCSCVDKTSQRFTSKNYPR